MTDSSDPSVPVPSPRITDSDREVAVVRLQNAAADGRLDLTEYEERLGAVYSARTRADLDALTADLPAVQAIETPPLDLRTKSGAIRKRGYWRVPSNIYAECTSGSIKIDFTEAECLHREVNVEASAASGSVVLIVPHGWSVDIDQASASSGSVVNRVRERPAPNAPVIRVRGTAKSGTIKARYPRRSFWVWLSDVLSRSDST